MFVLLELDGARTTALIVFTESSVILITSGSVQSMTPVCVVSSSIPYTKALRLCRECPLGADPAARDVH